MSKILSFGFAYDDGSVGEFYLFCLKEVDKPNPLKILIWA